jgi:hypothetical protein
MDSFHLSCPLLQTGRVGEAGRNYMRGHAISELHHVPKKVKFPFAELAGQTPGRTLLLKRKSRGPFA